jgi:hypothetical protein
MILSSVEMVEVSSAFPFPPSLVTIFYPSPDQTNCTEEREKRRTFWGEEKQFVRGWLESTEHISRFIPFNLAKLGKEIELSGL